MDIRLRQIVSKAAGIYFIVTDNSQVNAIEEESRLRVVFINAPKGPVNCLVKFAKGDTSSFTTIFGKANRSKEKKGDFGHKVCLDALSSGPLGVINLRVFDDEQDTTQVATINPNTCFDSGVRVDKVPYSSLFNKNGYWTPDRDILTEKYYENDGYLNFGNVGNSDVSVFVVKAKESEVSQLTEEYNKTLEECALEIDDYPNLDFNTRLSDTFVKVYVFNNTFAGAHLNATYGQYFESDDTITQENLEALTKVAGVGFIDSYVGSVIPGLVSETSENLSIDDIMYANYIYTGIICDINNELLEATNTKDFSMIDLYGFNSMFEEGEFKTITNLMSYKDNKLTFDQVGVVPKQPTNLDENKAITCKNALKYGVVEDTSLTNNTFKTNTGTGIRFDDLIIGEDRLLHITDIALDEPISEAKTYDIFASTGEGRDVTKAIVVDTQGGVFYNINGYKWETSTDGVNWKIIDLDFFHTPEGKTLTYENTYGNAVTYGTAVYAVAYCSEESVNYLVKYQSGEITMKKLGTTGTTDVNIVVNGNIFVVYGGLGVMYSTDGENWFAAADQHLNYITSGFGTQYRFFAYCNPGSFTDGFAEGFEEGDFLLKYSSDGQNWQELGCNYTSLTGLDITKNKNLILWDDVNVYMFTTGKAYYIAKTDLGNAEKSFTEKTVEVASTAFYPTIVKETQANTIFAIAGGATKKITFTKGETPAFTAEAISDMNNATRLYFAKNNKLAFFVGGDSDTNIYQTWDATTVGEGNFTMPYILEYQTATYTVDGKLYVGGETNAKYIIKVNPYVNQPGAILNNNVIQSYKLSERQFINGTSSRQSEILDMIMDPSIRKGLKNTRGLRYLIDAFKSYVEPDYKKQFSDLVLDLHENNRFVTCIMTEPFMRDIKKSSNPLFKDTPSSDVVNYEYFATGGNKQYSTKLLSKVDNQFLFFFGPGDIENGVVKPLTGLISNNFYTKQNQFDIIANTTGYVQGINELEEQIDDNDRKYLEKFRYNPIIDFNGYTIFGNLSAQKAISKQQQIHNVELLCYIKEQLYNMAKGGVFKKGTYDEYLATQIETQNFMDSLALANAIEPNPIVKCDLENNTQEIRNYKIKLVHVEYTPYDCLEKVVFDLNINK